MEELKICSRCKELKSNFYWKDKAKGKKQSRCTDCANLESKNAYWKKPETYREQKKPRPTDRNFCLCPDRLME